MSSNQARSALLLAKSLQAEAPVTYVPPSDGNRPTSQSVLPHSMIAGTRGYIEKVAYQINGSYEQGWFDACAVMMRRLLETLIIECFEANGIAHKIKNSHGDFMQLDELVRCTLAEGTWNLGRDAKRALRSDLKSIGDMSAHSRRYNAHRPDIDKLRHGFRILCQELIYLSGLK